MNRRAFLKLLGVTALAPQLPVEASVPPVANPVAPAICGYSTYGWKSVYAYRILKDDFIHPGLVCKTA